MTSTNENLRQAAAVALLAAINHAGTNRQITLSFANDVAVSVIGLARGTELSSAIRATVACLASYYDRERRDIDAEIRISAASMSPIDGSSILYQGYQVILFHLNNALINPSDWAERH
jgi:hypothetical protein